MKEVYLDNSATTQMDSEVFEEMMPFFSEIFGNPSSFHDKGKEAKDALENARERAAKILNCLKKEVIFTSGGTESINLAIKGVALANRNKGDHIITSRIEHHAVLESCEYLEKNGFEVTYLNVDKYGLIDPKDVLNAITEKTILISIMYANNEIGTIEPIEEIGAIAKEKRIYFHTDACQAAGSLPLDVNKLNVDLLTVNGSKIYGPKGSGLLFIRSGLQIEPLIHGGGQEFNLRSGTENVPAILGFIKALELSQKEMNEENIKTSGLRDYFISGLLKIPKSRLNGHPQKRLPNNINVSFLDAEGEAMLLHLNEKGIYASSGSACTSQSLETSHVLAAIGLPYEASHGSLRFSLGKWTTKDEVDYVLKVLPDIIETLRKISPDKPEYGALQMKNKNKRLIGDLTQMNVNAMETHADVKAKVESKSWFYTDIVKEHFFKPKNFLDGKDVKKYKADGRGMVGSPACGDMMSVWIKVNKKDDKIIEMKWQTFGCASALASTSMLSVMVSERGGMKIEDALKIKPQDIVKRLGDLPQRKFHCSVLGDKALRAAINDYFRKSGQINRMVLEGSRIVDKDTGITDKDIEEAVLEGADSLVKVQHKLKVGVSNKSCIPEVEQLIRFYNEKYFG